MCVNLTRVIGATIAIALLLPIVIRANDPFAADGHRIEQLIRDLGDRSFKVRDSAMRQLMELEPISALKKALKSEDPEIAKSANRILDELDKVKTRRSLRKLSEEMGRGQASQVIERFAGWNGPANDEASWQLIIDFAWNIANRTLQEKPVPLDAWLVRKGPLQNARHFIAQDFGSTNAVLIHSKERVAFSNEVAGFVRADGIEFKSLRPRGAFLSSDGLKCEKTIYRSIVLVYGKTQCASEISDSILICDGDVDVYSIGHSVIIANGTVKCRDRITNSVLISSGMIVADRARKEKGPNTKLNVYRENEPNPFGFIKWFTPAEVGLEVSAGKDVVRIERLHDGKIAMKSGLKLGDIVAAVDGAKVDSAEMFRKLLLRGVSNERCILLIQRGDQKLDALLDFRGEELAAERKKTK